MIAAGIRCCKSRATPKKELQVISDPSLLFGCYRRRGGMGRFVASHPPSYLGIQLRAERKQDLQLLGK